MNENLNLCQDKMNWCEIIYIQETEKNILIPSRFKIQSTNNNKKKTYRPSKLDDECWRGMPSKLELLISCRVLGRCILVMKTLMINSKTQKASCNSNRFHRWKSPHTCSFSHTRSLTKPQEMMTNFPKSTNSNQNHCEVFSE